MVVLNPIIESAGLRQRKFGGNQVENWGFRGRIFVYGLSAFCLSDQRFGGFLRIVKTEKNSATSGPLVLLVEDSPDDAFFFQRALRKTSLSCRFQHALDGKAAVDLIEEAMQLEGIHRGGEIPDVIFVDLKMPVMNGFEVLEWLQARSICPRPAIYVLSGSNQDADRARAAELGAAGYFVKPIKAETLSECLAGCRFSESMPIEAGN
jgi:CheY-like chemotaxis protein